MPIPRSTSITPTIPAAVWGEREIRDMYGLRAVGLPDERRLVLPDDWPGISTPQGRHGLSPAPDAHHRYRDLPLRQ